MKQRREGKFMIEKSAWVGRRGVAFVLAGLLTMLCGTAVGQSWTPEKPITILVGFPPGGSADQIARRLSFAAKNIIPVPVVVLNKVGAAGTIAAQATAEAKPDGYTLFVGGGSETTSVGNHKALPYDPRKSFVPVIKVSKAPTILIVRSDSRFADMRALLAEAKTGPEKVSYGSSGEGGIFHSTALVLEKQAGIKLLHVPYKGGSEALTALIAGQIDCSFGAYDETKSMIDAGRVRPLAVFSKTRTPPLPNIPTMIELGYAVALDNMKGLMAPAGLPDPIYRYLNDSFHKAMQTDKWKEYVTESGLTEDYADGPAFQNEIVEGFELIGRAVAK
jgi:tripartite-type tricarboxylate transporter receptor subunit TctC